MNVTPPRMSPIGLSLPHHPLVLLYFALWLVQKNLHISDFMCLSRHFRPQSLSFSFIFVTKRGEKFGNENGVFLPSHWPRLIFKIGFLGRVWLSSYGCRWEVWRAWGKYKRRSRRSQEELKLLECSVKLPSCIHNKIYAQLKLQTNYLYNSGDIGFVWVRAAHLVHLASFN